MEGRVSSDTKGWLVILASLAHRKSQLTNCINIRILDPQGLALLLYVLVLVPLHSMESLDIQAHLDLAASRVLLEILDWMEDLGYLDLKVCQFKFKCLQSQDYYRRLKGMSVH
jgi:hypothetical protein